MAQIFPFQAYRYTDRGGRLQDLVTQPYDKITPAMRERYLAASPHNLVRIILGESRDSDNESDNSYTRAAAYLKDWISRGILARDAEPRLFAYYQEFCVPDTGEKLVRKGFIGVGAVEDYSAGVVHRHEQTLSGPKKDRLELLRHTRAHFGQIFMLYPDPAGEIDQLLDEATRAAPLARVNDEYGAEHRLWKISEPGRIARIQALMSNKKLLIADGHHRYETALAFRNENPGLADAGRVMMTFVNMHSPGVKILATHRLVSHVPGFDVRSAQSSFNVEPLDSLDALKARWASSDRSIIGAAVGDKIYALEAKETGGLDVRVLHERILRDLVGIDEQAVRDEKHLRYIRGAEAALAEVQKGAAQIAFLLKPTSVEQVADIAFGGGVMPQKSTDFYPKLLSGLTIYRIEK